jgi:hypothetical protein
MKPNEQKLEILDSLLEQFYNLINDPDINGGIYNSREYIVDIMEILINPDVSIINVLNKCA